MNLNSKSRQLAGCGRFRLRTLLAVALGAIIVAGCSPDASESEQATTESIRVSDVPLRIQVLGEVLESNLIKRQWLANSDQPIEIITRVPEDSLEDLPACDVLIYPARRLGDMVRLEQVYELPATVIDADAEDSEGTFLPLSGAQTSQASFGGELYAVPLGQSMTHVIGNDALAKKLGEKLVGGAVSWDAILQGLGGESTLEQSAKAFNSDSADAEALVDRFLAIAASTVTKNPSYGLLFDLQTMQSLLHDDAFVEAASMLRQLATPEGAQQSVFGSHDDAWQWATRGDDPRVGIVTLTRLSKDAAAGGTGVALQIAGEQAMTWDTGDGLLASLSIHCRQTAQGISFLKWLRERQTRQSLSDWVVGIDSIQNDATSSPLLQEIYRHQADWRGSGAIPREPSLPRTHSFREILGEELLRIVGGQVEPAAGMKAASDRWSEIAKNEGGRLRKEYEDSLGLGF
ncbi:MAG: hypothetical protein ACE361_26980 [Aureliella sp.]